MLNTKISSLFLAASDSWFVGFIVVLIVAVVAIAAAVLCWFLGRKLYKSKLEGQLGDVKARADKMIEDATTECKALKK